MLTQSEGPRTRAKPLSPDERRSAIVTATLALLTEVGGDVSTRQIAEAAGVAEGTIFRVFDDKRQLLWAVLEHVVDAELTRQSLVDALSETFDLRGRIEAAVVQLAARSQRVMTVMMAVRTQLGTPEPGEQPGPPSALRGAQQHLQSDLAELVFAPSAKILRVTPDRAALVMRSVVLGFHHPGAHDDDTLTPAEISDILLHGVAAC